MLQLGERLKHLRQAPGARPWQMARRAGITRNPPPAIEACEPARLRCPRGRPRSRPALSPSVRWLLANASFYRRRVACDPPAAEQGCQATHSRWKSCCDAATTESSKTIGPLCGRRVPAWIQDLSLRARLDPGHREHAHDQERPARRDQASIIALCLQLTRSARRPSDRCRFKALSARRPLGKVLYGRLPDRK